MKKCNSFEERIRFVAQYYHENCFSEDAAWKKFALKHGIVRRPRISFLQWSAAAVILLLVGFGSYWFYNQRQADWIAESTVAGQIKDVFLPDSTVIYLSENTEIKYDRKSFGKGNRNVLLQGKAFFKVKRDETSPFSVKTKQTKVEVLGTSFQIAEYKDRVKVDVLTGKVRFEAESEEVLLSAGMGAIYKPKENNIEISNEIGENVMSWKEGILRFNHTPMYKVVNDLRDFYDINITSLSEEEKNLQLTTSFKDMSIDEVLRIINQTLDINLKTEKTK